MTNNQPNPVHDFNLPIAYRANFVSLALYSFGLLACFIFFYAVHSDAFPSMATGTPRFFKRTALPMTWLSGIGFVLIFFKFIKSLISQRPPLLLTEEGIDYCLWNCGIVKWADVTAIRYLPMDGNDMLCLVVRDEDTYLKRSPLWRRLERTMMRSKDKPFFHLSAMFIDANFNEICSRVYATFVRHAPNASLEAVAQAKHEAARHHLFHERPDLLKGLQEVAEMHRTHRAH